MHIRSFVLLLACVVSPGSAFAADVETAAKKTTFSLALNVGVAGSALLVVQGFDANPSLPDEYSLGTSVGGSLQADFPLHTNVTFGLQTRIAQWSFEGVEESASVVDIALAPRVRAVIPFAENGWIAPFLQPSLGFTMSEIAPTPLGLLGEEGFTPGVMLGLGVGVVAMMNQHLGVLLEVDWLYRELDVPFELPTDTVPIRGVIEYSINYLTLQVGLVVAP